MEMTARFTDKLSNEVKVQVFHDDGECISKSIYFRDFVKLLSKSMVDEGGSGNLRLGKLPKGYYDGSIDPFKPDTFSCIVTRPAQVLPLQYYDSVFRVPYPALVFAFHSEGGNITASRCFAVLDENVKDDTALYHYPFGNVYEEDGHICWGNINLSEFDTLKSIDRLVALFNGSESNSDLYRGYNSGFKALRSMLEELQKRTAFPAEWLAETGQTVGDVVRMFL